MLSFCVSFLRIFDIILVRVLRVFNVAFLHVFDVVFSRCLLRVFTLPFAVSFYTAFYAVFSTRFVWAKFRLLQSGKPHQEVDREVSRLRPQNTRVPAHPYEKDE